MKLSVKLGYMIVGAAIALTGFGIGSLVTSIDARDEFASFDTIYAAKVIATDFIAVGEPDAKAVLIQAIKPKGQGGLIRIFNADGVEVVSLLAGESGGIVGVSPNEGEGYARLDGNVGDGGLISAKSNDGKGHISLTSGLGSISAITEKGSVRINYPAGTVFVTNSDGVIRHLAIVK